MYWLNTQTIIIIALFSYFIGTLTGVYLAKISVFGAILWLVVGGLIAFGSVYVAGKNWGNDE